jgi:Protein of unknown function (DUF3618)
MKKTHEVERAERATLAARRQLAETLSELRARLDPDRLAEEVWTAARKGARDVAGDALLTARRRPFATGMLLASLLIFLARAPLWRAASRCFLQRRATRRGRHGLNAGREETTT